MSKYLIIRRNTKHNFAGSERYTWEQSDIVEADSPEAAKEELYSVYKESGFDKNNNTYHMEGERKHPTLTAYGHGPDSSVIIDIKLIQ